MTNVAGYLIPFPPVTTLDVERVEDALAKVSGGMKLGPACQRGRRTDLEIDSRAGSRMRGVVRLKFVKVGSSRSIQEVLDQLRVVVANLNVSE